MKKRKQDGRYYKHIPNGRNPDGSYRYKQVYGWTKKEVEEIAQEFINQQKLYQHEVDGKMLFKDVAELWLEATGSRLVPGTRKMYEAVINKHLNPVIGGYPLKELKGLQLQRILNNLTKADYSTKTIKTIFHTASRILDYAVDNELTMRNVFRSVIVPKGEGVHERRALTLQEQQAIIWTCQDHRMGVPALLMMMCGLRRGEIIALKWSDIDLENNVLTVNKAAMIENNRTSVKAPKTRAGNRRIPIPEGLHDLLVEEKKYVTSELVCPSADGHMMTEKSFRRAWDSYENFLKTYAKAFDKNDGTEHITPHMLRHTYATMLYDAGVDVKNAQRFLGHADVVTTLKIYTHLSEEKAKVGDELLDAYMSEAVRKGREMER